MNIVKQAIQGYMQNRPEQEISENNAALQKVDVLPLIQRVRNANLSLEEYAVFGMCITSHPQVNAIL